MEKKMELKDIWEHYGREDIIQTYRGFERHLKTLGLAVVIPTKFYRLWDGTLIDPGEMKIDRDGSMWQELMGLKGLSMPTALRFAFGEYEEDEDEKEKRFCFRDPMEDTIGLKDAIIEMDWDSGQGSSCVDWATVILKRWGGDILYQKTLSNDVYSNTGTQVWIIRVRDRFTGMMKLKAEYFDWLRWRIQKSDTVLQEFEENKAYYAEEIAKVGARLIKECNYDDCVVNDAPETDETIVIWSVMKGDEEIFKDETYRHDKIGLMRITERLDYALKERELYRKRFEMLAPQIQRQKMEIVLLEHENGVRIQRIQPPGKFLVGEFVFNEKGWRDLHEKCDFLRIGPEPTIGMVMDAFLKG